MCRRCAAGVVGSQRSTSSSLLSLGSLASPFPHPNGLNPRKYNGKGRPINMFCRRILEVSLLADIVTGSWQLTIHFCVLGRTVHYPYDCPLCCLNRLQLIDMKLLAPTSGLHTSSKLLHRARMPCIWGVVDTPETPFSLIIVANA